MYVPAVTSKLDQSGQITTRSITQSVSRIKVIKSKVIEKVEFDRRNR